MARSTTPRIHRLPKRLDYTLIPAPLDISFPIVDEKSPLPAIIVTPSSPACSTDFSIAFLAPPTKPSFRNRWSSFAESLQSILPFNARTTFILVLLMFILACHVLTHCLATRRPHLQFSNYEDSGSSGDVQVAQVSQSPIWNLFDFPSTWGSSLIDEKRDFIINESMTQSLRSR